MEGAQTIPCQCGKTMVNVGDTKRDEVPVSIYYHCPHCLSQVTVDAASGLHGGRFSQEMFDFLVSAEVLNALGNPGAKYPRSFLLERK